jgi:hypothetical protein
MKKYIGVKVFNVVPMNRREYYDFRSRGLSEDENGADEGYLVQYPDNGLVEWLLKDVFEKAYKVAETPLDRMRIERDELLEKYNKLVLFLGREDCERVAGEIQVALMRRQSREMHDYLLTLRTRIELMKETPHME